jgi:hypothetical protein
MLSKNGVSATISKICILLFFCSFLFFPKVIAYDVSEYTTFTSQDQFVVPDYSGAISFAEGGSYRNASLVDNIWRFEGLILASSPAFFPFFEGHNFSVSAQNCELNIIHYDTPEIFPPYSGILEYNVSGVGSQSFNLEYHYNEWMNYTVNIDGEEKTQNDGWTVSNDGWITVTGAKSTLRYITKRRPSISLLEMSLPFRSITALLTLHSTEHTCITNLVTTIGDSRISLQTIMFLQTTQRSIWVSLLETATLPSSTIMHRQ